MLAPRRPDSHFPGRERNHISHFGRSVKPKYHRPHGVRSWPIPVRPFNAVYRSHIFTCMCCKDVKKMGEEPGGEDFRHACHNNTLLIEHNFFTLTRNLNNFKHIKRPHEHLPEAKIFAKSRFSCHSNQLVTFKSICMVTTKQMS